MEITSDDYLKNITKINSNNYQVQKIDREKNIISNNFIKIKQEINQIINSNNKIKPKNLKDILNNNLFVPSVFKYKRINKSFNISKNISLEEILKQLKNKNKENKNDILSNDNNNHHSNINHSPKNVQNNISFNINIQNNIFNNNLENLSDKKHVLNKKRKLDKLKEKNESENIYNEIKRIYNNFIKDKQIEEKEKKNIVIYENKIGYLEHQEIIVIKNPVCVIYFNRENIENIFLINEQKNCKDEEEINFVLEKIKSEMESLYNELL